MGVRQTLINWLEQPTDSPRRGRQAALPSRKQSLAAPAILSVGPYQARWTDNNYQAWASEGYGGNPYVYAAIRQISMAVAGIPWKLYKDPTKKKPIDDHPLLDLINRPNPAQGRGRFLENFVGYLLLDGNCYIERAGGTPPSELYTLRPDRVRIIPGNALNPVAGYRYAVGAVTRDFPAEVVLHQKFFNPLDDFYGMSPMRAASKSTDQSNMSKSWNVALLQHGATPTGALKAPGNLSTKQDREIREWIEDSYAGYINAGRPIILEGGMDWAQMGINPTDMAWLEGQKLSAREIAMVFNIAPELIGDPDSKTYSNYSEARKALYEENVLPLLDWTRDDLNAWLCVLYPDEPFLDYDREEIEALHENQDAISTRTVSEWNAGAKRLQDVQKALGDDVDPDYGGYYKWQLPDKATIDPGPWTKPKKPVTITPVTPDQLPGGPNFPQLNAPGGRGGGNEPPGGGNQPSSGTGGTPTGPAAAGASGGGTPTAAGAGATAGGTKALAVWNLPTSNKARRISTAELKQHEDAIEKLREIWITRARAIFKQQLLPLKSYGRDQEALGTALAGAREEWIALIAGLYTRAGSAFATETIKSTASRSDIKDFSPDNPIYLQSLRSILDSYIAMEVPQRVDRILESLAVGIPLRAETLDAPPESKQPQDLTPRKRRRKQSDSEDPNQQYNATPDDFNTLFEDAALVIAEAEVVTASNLGPIAGAAAFEDAYGVQLVKTWQALHDDHTRPEHLDADGQTVLLAAPFSVGDEELLFPLDESRGASAKNVRYCRCVVTFDVSEVATLNTKQSAGLLAQRLTRLSAPPQQPPSATAETFFDGLFHEMDAYLTQKRGR